MYIFIVVVVVRYKCLSDCGCVYLYETIYAVNLYEMSVCECVYLYLCFSSSGRNYLFGNILMSSYGFSGRLFNDIGLKLSRYKYLVGLT